MDRSGIWMRCAATAALTWAGSAATPQLIGLILSGGRNLDWESSFETLGWSALFYGLLFWLCLVAIDRRLPGGQDATAGRDCGVAALASVVTFAVSCAIVSVIWRDGWVAIASFVWFFFSLHWMWAMGAAAFVHKWART